jgi:hypothetical protein
MRIKNREGNGHALFTDTIMFLLHMSDAFYGKENVTNQNNNRRVR